MLPKRVGTNRLVGPLWAYPDRLMFPAAAAEAADATQFPTKESKKLEYFASAPNLLAYSNSPSFWWVGTVNYLNYWVLPRLDRLKEYGWQIFYELGDLPGFVNAALTTAPCFLAALQGALDEVLSGRVAVDDIEKMSLGPLGSFWNLDTGLGLRISKVESDTPKEVITKLKFGHVVDLVNRTPIGCNHDSGYIAHMKNTNYPDNPKSAEMPGQKIEKGAEFDDLSKVKDPGAGKYLDRIRLRNATSHLPSGGPVSGFFKCSSKDAVPKGTAPTDRAANGSSNTFKLCEVRPRLNIIIETAIADIRQGKEDLAFYLLNDNLTKRDDAVYFNDGEEHIAQNWLKGKLKSRTGATHAVRHLDFVPVIGGIPTVTRDGLDVARLGNLRLCNFHTQVLMNLGKDSTKPAGNQWVDFVDPKSTGDALGRNFAVATGRIEVLKPNGDGRFWADGDFDCYKRTLSPTEHVFFSLAVLVADCRKDPPEIYEQFSQAPVTQEQLPDIVKIDSVNFLKIVLFYKLYSEGAVQLDECYIDN